MDELKSEDHKLWKSRIKAITGKLYDRLNYSKIPIKFFNEELTPELAKKFAGKTAVSIWFGDIDEAWISKKEQSQQYLAEADARIVYVTDCFFRDGWADRSFRLTDNITILQLPEMFGVYFVDRPPKRIEEFEKDYLALMQRAQWDRLEAFLMLYEANMLEQGYVSYLGEDRDLPLPQDSTTRQKKARQEKTLHSKGRKWAKDVRPAIKLIPFQNFEEVPYLHELEEKSRYSLVFETYNDVFHQPVYCFTEKTFRSLIVSNITLISNSLFSTEYLTRIGYRLHVASTVNISEYTDRMEYFMRVIQTQKDPDLDLLHETACHNYEVLKKQWETINDENYVDNLFEEIVALTR